MRELEKDSATSTKGKLREDEMEGVYVIWPGGENPVTLRVGQDLIRECLSRESNNEDLLACPQDEIYVTWAKVD